MNTGKITTEILLPSEFDRYYTRYINKLPLDINLIEGFETGRDIVRNFFLAIPNEKHQYKYAPGKWSIKEVLQHLIDTERIFIHRCFRIARHDITPLAGFDQTIYVDPSHANQKSMDFLLEEFNIGRQNSILFLKSISIEDLAFIGNANDSLMSARAAAFVIIGHELWHMDIIKEKYL